MMETIKENLSIIQADIVPYTPKIIAVTKYFGQEGILNAYKAGLRDFGESKANDAIEKIISLPKKVRENSTFHFIGHLQTNKVRKVVENFDVIHSIDTLKLAQFVSDEAIRISKTQDVLLQVNNACEEQKFGFSKSELRECFSSIMALKNINVLGLMNIAPLGVSENRLDELFSDMKEFKSELEQKHNCKLSELSMGMSCDYKIAVRNGATILRIGRKLFRK